MLHYWRCNEIATNLEFWNRVRDIRSTFQSSHVKLPFKWYVFFIFLIVKIFAEIMKYAEQDRAECAVCAAKGTSLFSWGFFPPPCDNHFLPFWALSLKPVWFLLPRQSLPYGVCHCHWSKCITLIIPPMTIRLEVTELTWGQHISTYMRSFPESLHVELRAFGLLLCLPLFMISNLLIGF